VSHHLQDLKKIGLVADDKRGQYIYYKMTDEGKRVTGLIFKILK
jgi:DNA-binding transcriptional ArsR family regulator